MSLKVKKAIARSAAPLGALRMFGSAKSRLTRELMLLGYHRILPLGIERGSHKGDIELVSATPDDFSWQVEYMSRHFEPVSFAQIADYFDGRGDLPRKAFAITFDDGFSDVFEHAFPILGRHGVSATVFVSTGYVGSKKPFWFDLVAWLVATATPGSTFRDGEGTTYEVPEGDGCRSVAIHRILKWLKSCSERERESAIQDLHDRFGSHIDRMSKDLGTALSWEQLKEMHAGGIEFGSHTVSHRCLARLDPNQVLFELQESKRAIENAVNAPIVALAYPFGGPSAFSQSVITTAKQVGYRVATTYISGKNKIEASDRYSLFRQHVERDTTHSYFEALVNMPEIFR